MRCTVCGAGPAGLGIAACLMSKGHEVYLYDMPDYADRIQPFVKNPELKCRGFLEYTGRLIGASVDAAQALEGAEAIFIVTHAAAHKQLARLFSGKFQKQQLLVMCPGYVGGGIEFTAALKEAGAEVIPSYMEASSLPIISKNEETGAVRITGWKRNFILYRPQPLDSHGVSHWFEELFSPLKISRHPVEPGLNEINFIVHAVVSLLNASIVERKEPWTFYRLGLSPAVMRIVELIDQERVELEIALGLPPHPLTKLLSEFYSDQGMHDGGLYEQLSTFAPFAPVQGPQDFNSRFISEDLSYGLVPMSWLGEQKNLPMPYTNLMIQLASGYTGTDYRQNGRKLTL